MTVRTVVVRKDCLAEDRASADEWRRRHAARGTLVVQVLSSPGAGKTTLLAETARRLAGLCRVAVLVGDIATDRDARRFGAVVPAVAQLTTGGACHLELPLVTRGWRALGEPESDILFIEDVGNLVCPASHDLGQHLRVVLLSTPEGDDKPAKYPKAFRTSQALAITKLDLAPHVPFSFEAAVADARSIQPELMVFGISAIRGDGMEIWCEYLLAERNKLLRRHDVDRPAPV